MTDYGPFMPSPSRRAGSVITSASRCPAKSACNGGGSVNADDAEPAAAGQGSPLASALIDTVRRYDLPAEAFDHILEGRVFDLYADPMGDRRAFEAYAGETQSSVVMLAAMILDRAEAPKVADAAGHAGVAACAAWVLRDAERHRARHQVFVPSDILDATGLDASGWLAGGGSTEAARQALVAFGREHLQKAEAQVARLRASVRPALLPALFAARSTERAGTSAAEPIRRLWYFWRTMRR